MKFKRYFPQFKRMPLWSMAPRWLYRLLNLAGGLSDFGGIQKSGAAGGKAFQNVSEGQELSSIPVAAEVYSLHDLVSGVIQSFTSLASSKYLALYACLSPDLPEQVIGDSKNIYVILERLLSNAIRFTDGGRVVLRVKAVACDSGNPTLQWQVSDTGKGIEPQSQQQLFMPFEEDTGPRLRKLSLCHKLARGMGGDLRIVSEVGLGSSFTLSVPLNVPAAPARLQENLRSDTVYVVSPARELAHSVCGWLRRWGAHAQVGRPLSTTYFPGQLLLELHLDFTEEPWVSDWDGPLIIANTVIGSGSGPRSANINDLKSIRKAVRKIQKVSASREIEVQAASRSRVLDLHVLVVESNPFYQSMLREQLHLLGCTLTLCTDNISAIKQWNSAFFNVVLTQVNSPRINGYSLAMELRRQGCLTPIIGIKANVTPHYIGVCLSHGMDECLAAPLTASSLFRCLAMFTKGSS